MALTTGGAAGPLLLKPSSKPSSKPSNIFVAPPSSDGLGTNGSDSDGTNCKRFFPPVAAPPGGVGHGCETFAKAYSLAAAGDTVALNWNGAWATSQEIGPSGSKSGSSKGCKYPHDIAGCVTFRPAPGLTPSITANSISNGALVICANYVALSGITLNPATYTDSQGTAVSEAAWYVGAGDVTCQPNGGPPHDIFIANVTANGPVGIVGGAYNVYVLGGSIGNSYNLPVQMGGPGGNGATSGVHNSTFDGVTFHNFLSTDSSRYHMECLHMDYAGDSNTVKNSRFEGCPVFSIRVEAEGDPTKNADRQTNHLFENNFFDGASVNFDCHDDGCQMTGNIVRFNTLNAIFAPTADCKLQSSNTCTVGSNTFYGNVVDGGCPPSLAAFGAGWTAQYNVWTGGSGSGTICSGDKTSAYGARISLVAPGQPNYDDHLSKRSQKAIGWVPATVRGGYPATDIDGDVRPSRAASDAGADQWETANMVLGRSIGAVRIGEPEAEVMSRFGRPQRSGTIVTGKQRLNRAVYRIHGGSLWVFTDGGRVIGVGTSTPYYTTRGGVGVGTHVSRVRAWPGVGWIQCESAYRRVFSGVAVYAVPTGGRKGAKIGNISMLKASYKPC
jgi:hypothetical protein